MADSTIFDAFDEKRKERRGIYLAAGKIKDTRFYCIYGDGVTLLIGDVAIIEEYALQNSLTILYRHIECVNSMIPLKNTAALDVRIEPGAIIRESVNIGKGAIILMGAIINLNASIGEHTMVDMNAVIGSGARIGANVHIGAGAVIAGMLEPACTIPVIIEDDVMIGANAVVLEGIRIGKGAVVGAGAVVTKDVPEGMVVTGVPARIIKHKSQLHQDVTISQELRK